MKLAKEAHSTNVLRRVFVWILPLCCTSVKWTNSLLSSAYYERKILPNRVWLTTTFSAFASQSRIFLSNRIRKLLLVRLAPISIRLTALRVFQTLMIAIQCHRPMWTIFFWTAATQTILSTLVWWANFRRPCLRRLSTTFPQATSTHRAAAVRTFQPLQIHRYKVIGRLPFCRPIRQCPRCPPAKCIIRRRLPRRIRLD